MKIKQNNQIPFNENSFDFAKENLISKMEDVSANLKNLKTRFTGEKEFAAST